MQGNLLLFMLSMSTAGSFLIATSSVISLQPDDRISIPRGLLLTTLGFAFFLSTFELVNCVALLYGRALRHKYKLTWGHVLDISNKVVSGVQAVLSCVAGAVVCLWSCRRDVAHTSHFVSEAYAWFGTAYFFYDIWSMYKVHIHMSSEKRSSRPRPSFLSYCRHEPLILFHHLFIGGFGFLVIVYLRGGLGDCVFGTVYLMEISTPFVSARGILSRLGMKQSGLYLYNGLAMLATFFVFRVLSLPYICLLYSRAVGLPYLQSIGSLPPGCKVSIAILLLPQLYWFFLMGRGALKVFFPGGGKKEVGNKKQKSS